MSILARKKSGRGRPPIDSEEVRSRFSRELLDRVDGWIALQLDPKPTRSEAVRRLVGIGLSARPSPQSADERLARVEQKLARKIPAKVSPERGVALMRKGLAEVEHRALVEKQAVKSSRNAATKSSKDDQKPVSRQKPAR
jgi:hypothetical protein